MTEQVQTITANGPAPAPHIDVRRRGALVEFVLNRPRQLNAFDDGMRLTLATEIPKIARDPDVYIVALASSSPRAFCAGGDIRALVAAASQDMAKARAMFAAEYQLDWLLECFSKPTLSLINGVCMGSGAGLTSFNTHRVAGEGYSWAMPETAIGLFPDVGMGHVLARMPWPLGLYLGLTGQSVGRADAYWLGLATHCIDEGHHAGILSALSDAEPVDPMLDGLHQDPYKGPLQAEMGMIREYFSHDTLRAILLKLPGASGVSKDWAGAVLAALRKRCPVSLAVTDHHIRSCRALDLRETLIQDYRIAWRCLEGRDFAEGVRAAIIDKDNAPCWSHARVEDVQQDEIARYFAPLGRDDLELPSRDAMQAARV